MRAYILPEVPATVTIDQMLIDGEFDEFEDFAAFGNGATQADFEDSWSDEELLELL